MAVACSACAVAALQLQRLTSAMCGGCRCYYSFAVVDTIMNRIPAQHGRHWPEMNALLALSKDLETAPHNSSWGVTRGFAMANTPVYNN